MIASVLRFEAVLDVLQTFHSKSRLVLFGSAPPSTSQLLGPSREIEPLKKTLNTVSKILGKSRHFNLMLFDTIIDDSILMILLR